MAKWLDGQMAKKNNLTMKQFINLIIKNYITIAKGNPEIHGTREMETPPTRDKNLAKLLHCYIATLLRKRRLFDCYIIALLI